MRLMFIPVFLMTFGQLIRANSIKSSANQITDFIILHNNDMHARFEQTNKYGSVCNQDDASMNKCFGGFARVAHE